MANNSPNSRLIKAVHDFLQRGKHLHDKYQLSFLTTLCGTVAALHKDEGFLAFMNHLDYLPDICKRCEVDNDWRSENIAIYIITQCASILLGNGDWLAAFKYSDQYKFEYLKDIVLGEPIECTINEIKDLPIRCIDKNIKQAIANDNVAALKLHIDFASNPETKLKYVYNYLLRNKKHDLAGQLHSIFGRLDDLVPHKVLFAYWRNKIIYNYKQNHDTSDSHLLIECQSPADYQIYKFILQGPYASHAINLLRNEKSLDKNNLKAFWENNTYLDFPIIANFPNMTYRNLMHFITEFAKDIIKADIDESLTLRTKEALEFVKWENQKG